jgi:4-hydroxybenzoate polyprenyltransferase
MKYEQVKNYIYLMRLHKPIGIFLLLWPTLWALWLAGEGKPNIIIVCIFILGVILMRSAGCIINDFADRKFDRFVERTRDRPLASGKISSRTALVLFFVLLAAAFFLVLLLNRFTILLAFVGAILAVVYPFLKRITHLPQLGLGLAFSWGIPMAFAAIMNTVPDKSWILFIAAVIWPVIYDTMYAMVDREDDEKIGVKSTAILFGKWDRGIIATFQLIFILLLIECGFLFSLHYEYFICLGLVILLFVYQQWLIKDRNREKCFRAFLNNHWVGMLIFFGIAISGS